MDGKKVQKERARRGDGARAARLRGRREKESASAQDADGAEDARNGRLKAESVFAERRDGSDWQAEK